MAAGGTRIGGRAVEGTGLENRQGRKSFVGSNPALSARILASHSGVGMCAASTWSATSYAGYLRACDRKLIHPTISIGPLTTLNLAMKLSSELWWVYAQLRASRGVTMALVRCKECGAEISTKAVSCPKCGAVGKAQAGRTGCLTWVIAFFVVAGVIGAPRKRVPRHRCC
jgi:hypothetical protein